MKNMKNLLNQQTFASKQAQIDDLCRRRFIWRQSAEIYGGVAGFYCYGPPGAAMKSNITTVWRNHFVLEEQLQEVEDTCTMPAAPLKASGHVDRFSDLMVHEVANKTKVERADKLLEDVMEERQAAAREAGDVEKEKECRIVAAQADAYSKEELHAVFIKYGIMSRDGNDLCAPYEFNLMFPQSIGPTGYVHGFLRPETAQGIFLNYKFCLEQNGNRLPFGIAQVGRSFRNEIAPRAGITRQREFSQAEIEFFCKPHDKTFAKFSNVRQYRLKLFPASRQLSGDGTVEMTIGEAVDTGLVANQTLGYFVARTQMFMEAVGANRDHMRFRQHLPTEMAHYACDCWDLEADTCYGWLEIVGVADRSCYDLKKHSEASGSDLKFKEKLDTPEEVSVCQLTKKAANLVQKRRRKDGKAVKEYIAALPAEQLKCHAAEAAEKGVSVLKILNFNESGEDREFELSAEMLQLDEKTEKVFTKAYYPSVIEPAFGIDRVIFAVVQHSYYERPAVAQGDKALRAVLRLPVAVAPTKVAIIPLDARVPRSDKYSDVFGALSTSLRAAAVRFQVDDTGATVGKRYARADEVGVPFCVTIDFDSLRDSTVTVRERDTCRQLRCPSSAVSGVVDSVQRGVRTFEECIGEHGEVANKATSTAGVEA